MKRFKLTPAAIFLVLILSLMNQISWGQSSLTENYEQSSRKLIDQHQSSAFSLIKFQYDSSSKLLNQQAKNRLELVELQTAAQKALKNLQDFNCL